MKFKIFLTAVLSGWMCFNLFASDTLSIYDKTSTNSLYYNPKTYSKQVARFDLERPASLKNIILSLDGPADAKMRITLLGHEGGVMLPDLFNPLTKSIYVNKTKAGKENINVSIPDDIYLSNNLQFFL